MTALAMHIRETASRANRARVARIERRLDEKAKVYGIADEYGKADREGDLRIEKAFVRLYQAAVTERMRDLVVAAYTAWMDDERNEQRAVDRGVQSAIAQMEGNDELWTGEALA